MSSSTSSQSKSSALDAIKSYRVSELQALLDYANLTRQGNKRDLFQRCKLLITSNFTPQLANKVQQINSTRTQSSRSHHHHHVSSSTSSRQHPIVIPKTPPMEILPPANHIQFMNLPFFEKMRTIECSNMPIDWHTFSPIRFVLNETDIDLVRKNSAKVFLRIAPTILHERHNDVLPPFIFVQCNNQAVLNNNISRQVGSSAHSFSFPTDITDKIILKSNASNTLTFIWLQSPTNMSFKNVPRSYTLSIQLVHCVSLETLLDIICKREPYLTKTDYDSDIEIEDLGLMTTRHRVSLLCPITQSLIVIPAKSTSCSHQTCFDLKAFLQMNERRLQWTCPICKKSALFDSLRIDHRLRTILANVPANCSTVEIDSATACQYIFDNVKQEKLDVVDPTHIHPVDEDDSTHDLSTKSRRQSEESDCIVLSSGSESEDDDDDDGLNNFSSPVTATISERGDVDERQIPRVNDLTARLTGSVHSTPSPIMSSIDDGNYWEDIAQMTYDLSHDVSEKSSNRKRSNSSTSSVLSSSHSKLNDEDDDRHRRKRNKRPSPTTSQQADIEIITLTSSDSDDDDANEDDEQLL